MPGCIDCIEEKMDDGYDEKQAVFMSQYPWDLVVILPYEHVYLCFRHKVTRYVRKRPEKLPTMGPRGPDKGIAK